MRVKDKAILEAFFSMRKDCFQNNIEDPTYVGKKLLEMAAEINNLDGLDKAHGKILNMSTLLSHYREICYFAGIKPDAQVMEECRASITIPDGVEDVPNNLKAACLLAIGMSYVPFIRGVRRQVFDKLVENQAFGPYFNNAKIAIDYFRQIRDLDLDISVQFICDDIEEEIYGVWQEYASEYHLSDYIYVFFLNSKMNFEELEILNNKHLEEIEGLGNEWKDK